jgi:hypothetical protein
MSWHLEDFVPWFFQFESYVPAIVVTVIAALLFACGIGAVCAPCKEKDEFFHRHVS